MKSTLLPHQKPRLDRVAFAWLWEQGTGKTVIALAEAEELYTTGEIKQLLIIAPKGVHSNWVRREIPKHLECEHTAIEWGITPAKLKKLMAANRKKGLVILAINYEALTAARGWEFATEFVQAAPTMIVADESSYIKNPKANRTKRAIQIARECPYRRILNGTPVENAPLDLYSQFEFLGPAMLKARSHRSFVARYAQLLPPDSRLVQLIKSRHRGNPQVIARDSQGEPLWQNLDELRQLIEPHSSRLRKTDCVDLPEKLYTRRYFDLGPKEKSLYRRIKEEHAAEIEEALITVTPLTALTKLQQIASGFVLEDGEPIYLSDNPRMRALQALLDEAPEEPTIIWARFREELAALSRETGAIPFDGGSSAEDRQRAVEDFQSGRTRFFIGNPAVGGRGLTLTRAKTVIFYSNSFNYGHRAQSEDRAHRIGQKNNVLYIDLIANGTIDERIVDVLQRKRATAEEILDPLVYIERLSA